MPSQPQNHKGKQSKDPQKKGGKAAQIVLPHRSLGIPVNRRRAKNLWGMAPDVGGAPLCSLHEADPLDPSTDLKMTINLAEHVRQQKTKPTTAVQAEDSKRIGSLTQKVYEQMTGSKEHDITEATWIPGLLQRVIHSYILFSVGSAGGERLRIRGRESTPNAKNSFPWINQGVDASGTGGVDRPLLGKADLYVRATDITKTVNEGNVSKRQTLLTLLDLVDVWKHYDQGFVTSVARYAKDLARDKDEAFVYAAPQCSDTETLARGRWCGERANMPVDSRWMAWPWVEVRGGGVPALRATPHPAWTGYPWTAKDFSLPGTSVMVYLPGWQVAEFEGGQDLDSFDWHRAVPKLASLSVPVCLSTNGRELPYSFSNVVSEMLSGQGGGQPKTGGKNWSAAEVALAMRTFFCALPHADSLPVLVDPLGAREMQSLAVGRIGLYMRLLRIGYICGKREAWWLEAPPSAAERSAMVEALLTSPGDKKDVQTNVYAVENLEDFRRFHDWSRRRSRKVVFVPLHAEGNPLSKLLTDGGYEGSAEVHGNGGMLWKVVDEGRPSATMQELGMFMTMNGASKELIVLTSAEGGEKGRAYRALNHAIHNTYWDQYLSGPLAGVQSLAISWGYADGRVTALRVHLVAQGAAGSPDTPLSSVHGLMRLVDRGVWASLIAEVFGPLSDPFFPWHKDRSVIGLGTVEIADVTLPPTGASNSKSKISQWPVSTAENLLYSLSVLHDGASDQAALLQEAELHLEPINPVANIGGMLPIFNWKMFENASANKKLKINAWMKRFNVAVFDGSADGGKSAYQDYVERHIDGMGSFSIAYPESDSVYTISKPDKNSICYWTNQFLSKLGLSAVSIAPNTDGCNTLLKAPIIEFVNRDSYADVLGVISTLNLGRGGANPSAGAGRGAGRGSGNPGGGRGAGCGRGPGAGRGGRGSALD